MRAVEPAGRDLELMMKNASERLPQNDDERFAVIMEAVRTCPLLIINGTFGVEVRKGIVVAEEVTETAGEMAVCPLGALILGEPSKRKGLIAIAARSLNATAAWVMGFVHAVDGGYWTDLDAKQLNGWDVGVRVRNELGLR